MNERLCPLCTPDPHRVFYRGQHVIALSLFSGNRVWFIEPIYHERLPMKFIHTADWQLGAKMLQAGPRASEARESRFRAVERLVDLATKEKVDFVLVAGDTFESPDIDDDVVRKTVNLLNRFHPLPVYILPGNHDPFVPGGIWGRPSWRRVGDHVRLLSHAEEVRVGEVAAGEAAAGPGVCLYPCPITQKRSRRDPTDWIPPRAHGDGRIRIGLAHGALDILPGETPNFPIRPDRPEVAGLDYLALGDWHGLKLDHPLAPYPGTIEGTGYAEKDPGHVLVVEIDEPGAQPVLRPEEVGHLRWVEVQASIGDDTDLSVLEERVGPREVWARLLLRIRAEILPRCPSEAFQAFQALQDELAEGCFHLDLETVESRTLDVALPEGIVARADEILETVLDGTIPEGGGRAIASEPPEVVSEARSLLHRLAAEVLR